MACRLRVLVVDTPDRLLPLKIPFWMSKLLPGCCFYKGGGVFLTGPGIRLLTPGSCLWYFFVCMGSLDGTLLGKVE
jgi:hypothetical protein